MRGGLERWKRGVESRGVRQAIAYALEGTCDAHLHPGAGVDALEAYTAASLTRYRGRVVVLRVIEVEMAVLKGIIGAFVVSIDGRKGLYKEQRRVLKRLATALSERPEHLDRLHAEDFAAAETDAARRRVIVDQVASLTDRFAIEWHARMIGPVDLRELGLRSGDGRTTLHSGFAMPEPIAGLWPGEGD